MKKIVIGVLLTGILLGGCVGGTQAPSTSDKLEQSIETRVGTISTKMGDEYLMTTEDGIVNLSSNKVDLESYMKKAVSVTGMFSGSTLYVDTIENATN